MYFLIHGGVIFMQMLSLPPLWLMLDYISRSIKELQIKGAIVCWFFHLAWQLTLCCKLTIVTVIFRALGASQWVFMCYSAGDPSWWHIWRANCRVVFARIFGQWTKIANVTRKMWKAMEKNKNLTYHGEDTMYDVTKWCR